MINLKAVANIVNHEDEVVYLNSVLEYCGAAHPIRLLKPTNSRHQGDLASPPTAPRDSTSPGPSIFRQLRIYRGVLNSSYLSMISGQKRHKETSGEEEGREDGVFVQIYGIFFLNRKRLPLFIPAVESTKT